MIARQKFAKPVPVRHGTRPDLSRFQGPTGAGAWYTVNAPSMAVCSTSTKSRPAPAKRATLTPDGLAPDTIEVAAVASEVQKPGEPGLAHWYACDRVQLPGLAGTRASNSVPVAQRP